MQQKQNGNKARLLRKRDVVASVAASLLLAILAAFVAGSDNHREAAAKTAVANKGGFTLIEISIVLIIIGLIAGGVLVGRTLITAAAVRSTVTQVERFNMAVNTFYGKYGYLPGDIKDPQASSFGFIARGQYAGEGDGNGFIEGATFDQPAHNSGVAECGGETVVFWRDLSTAGLINNTFNTVTELGCAGAISTANLNLYFPAANLGGGNYFWVWSDNNVGSGATLSATNYYGLANVWSVSNSSDMFATPGLTPAQALGIDTKMDDGLPQSGNVVAVLGISDYCSNGQTPVWIAGGTVAATNCFGASNGYRGSGKPTTAATPGSSTTCYDNANGSGPQQYSVEQNGGNGVNCALSFRFQ